MSPRSTRSFDLGRADESRGKRRPDESRDKSRSVESRDKSRSGAAALAAGATLALLALAQCQAADEPPKTKRDAAFAVNEPRSAAIAAWDTIYRVLQHPRCVNCHPAGDQPLQGDASVPHAQNVRRGPDGHGLFAMRCDACHQGHNLDGAHLPPGAPTWHLPSAATPLVFEGKSSGELCRLVRDPATNGGKSKEQLFAHMAHDPLVLWGWSPGIGRAPVSVPHDELVSAVRAWVDGDCACPE